MGYRGKVEERVRARELRAKSWTLQEIADELGVAKGSVSIWVRDVLFEPKPRNRGHPGHRPHPLTLKKEREIEQCRRDADDWLGAMSERDLTMFALGLYAGEGDKSGRTVGMANTNPSYLRLFVIWLRRHYDIDESRLRAKLYLHDGLDLRAATTFWSGVVEVPESQFRAPHRAVPDQSRRRVKHLNGCATVLYSCAFTARRLLAQVEAISSRFDIPG